MQTQNSRNNTTTFQELLSTLVLSSQGRSLGTRLKIIKTYLLKFTKSFVPVLALLQETNNIITGFSGCFSRISRFLLSMKIGLNPVGRICGHLTPDSSKLTSFYMF